MSSSAYLAGGVTVGVAPSAVAGVSPADIAEVASSADLAEVASSANHTGDVIVGVTSSAVAEVASSADMAEVASSADLAEVASLADLAGNVTVGVTSLADPASVVTTGAAFQEKYDVLSGSVCGYDDCFYDGHYDDNLDYFDYDYPSDFDVYGFIEPDDELCHDLHGLDACGVYCVYRYDAGVMPYWNERETFMRVMLPCTGPSPMSRSPDRVQ